MAGLTVNNNSQVVQKDYSKMNLYQLEKERESLFSQAQTDTEYYPELAEQYHQIDKKIQMEIDKKTYGGITGISIARVDSQIYDVKLALQKVTQKRATLSFQLQTAKENYPELVEQYHALDKQLESEKLTLEKQLQLLKQQKADLIAQNTEPAPAQNQNSPLDIIKLLFQPQTGNLLSPNIQSSGNQNQQNILIQILMLLLQGGFGSAPISQRTPNFEIPEAWQFENRIRNL